MTLTVPVGRQLMSAKQLRQATEETRLVLPVPETAQTKLAGADGPDGAGAAVVQYQADEALVGLVWPA